jgi:hypothetical protein
MNFNGSYDMGKRVSKLDYEKIIKNTLKRLYSNQAFSKGHLLYERLTSGIPPHLKGYVPDILDELVKKELVLFYGKTKYGKAYQLNIKKLKEIEGLIF